MNGKGDTPRPTDQKRFEAGYKAIRWKSAKRKRRERMEDAIVRAAIGAYPLTIGQRKMGAVLIGDVLIPKARP